jgi:glycosyltransferase 2 family protein
VSRTHSALTWLGLLVTALFSYLAVRHVHWAEAWAGFRASNAAWLVPAFAGLVLAVLMRVIRWRYLFRPETRPPLAAVARALLIGYFFNNVLPARAGEAARVLALNRSSGNSRAELAATVVVERIFDVIALVGLLFVTSPWLPSVSWARGAAAFGGVLVAGSLCVIAGVAIWGERPFRLLLRPLAFLPFVGEERLGRAALNLIGGLAGIRQPKLAAAAALWTTLSWLALGLSSWFVLVAFHLHLSPLAGLLTVIAINLALVLPSSPAAVGVFEAATLVALSAYGVATSTALPAALVLHLLNLVPYLAAGAIVLALERSQRAAVKQEDQVAYEGKAARQSRDSERRPEARERAPRVAEADRPARDGGE